MHRDNKINKSNIKIKIMKKFKVKQVVEVYVRYDESLYEEDEVREIFEENASYKCNISIGGAKLDEVEAIACHNGEILY